MWQWPSGRTNAYRSLNSILPMRTKGAFAEETSRRVREAAVRVFAQKGFSAVGVRELAQDAGLTSSALYHYMSR